MSDRPPYRADRFMRCVVRFVAARATEIRAASPLELRLSGALVRYWEQEARKAARHGA